MGNKIIKNVGIILACSIFAKILSYIWEAALAAYLGTSDEADAFYITTSVFSILSLFLGIFSGLTTFVSQYFGAQKYSACGKMLWMRSASARYSAAV